MTELLACFCGDADPPRRVRAHCGYQVWCECCGRSTGVMDDPRSADAEWNAIQDAVRKLEDK
jgi:hypothetical protein